MKKTFIFAIVLAGLTLCGCEPVIDDQAMGDVLTAEQLDIDVTNITEGSNAIVLKNNTPRTGAYWDTGIGVSTRQCDTIVMPYVGDIEIKFTGICDGGQVTTSRNVHITRIDHPIQKEWTLFAGSGTEGKTWTWDIDGTGGVVYGTAGWLTQDAPAWDVKPLDQLEDRDCSLVFDLNGGANVSKVDANGKVIEKGTFSFDMSATKKNPDNGAQWSIGQLKLNGVSMLSGHAFYDASNVVTTFEILKLSDNELVLCYNLQDADAWTDATFWMLRKK